MKKKNWWKITLLILAILACVSIPIILYFTIGQKDTSNNKIDLNGQSVSYLADVQHMNNITEQEANTIKNDIQTRINTKLSSLNLEETTDYTINNLNTIKLGTNLGDITITVNSVSNSSKTTGSFNLTLNVREDMSDRSIATINIPASEENGLTEDTVDTILLTIRINTEDVLTEGQDNKLNRDFQINNVNLIKAGAAFTDYQDQITIIPITSSTHLKGSFKINFRLQ